MHAILFHVPWSGVARASTRENGLSSFHRYESGEARGNSCTRAAVGDEVSPRLFLLFSLLADSLETPGAAIRGQLIPRTNATRRRLRTGPPKSQGLDDERPRGLNSQVGFSRSAKLQQLRKESRSKVSPHGRVQARMGTASRLYIARRFHGLDFSSVRLTVCRLVSRSHTLTGTEERRRRTQHGGSMGCGGSSYDLLMDVF